MAATTTSNKSEALTKVVLVDDHASLREMLRIVLRIEGGYEVVGEASGGLEAMSVCIAQQPGIVILDLALPGLDGTHLMRLLKREKWGVRVVIYSGAMDENLMREALAEEPDGFVRKEDSLPELRAALRAVAAGGRYVSQWASKLMPVTINESPNKLNAPERAVLHMIGEGLRTQDIAKALGATAKTVDHHRQHLKEKLGLSDMAALMRYALRSQG